jgi:hypothetical protein
MTRLIFILTFCLVAVSCSKEHPDISGQTTVNYSIDGVEYTGDTNEDFSRVVNLSDTREVFIYSEDITGLHLLDMKLTLPINENGTFTYSGSLEDTSAYMFFTRRIPGANPVGPVEYYAPVDSTVAGTVTTTINNGNHIRGTFNLRLQDTNAMQPDLQITDSYFDIRY